MYLIFNPPFIITNYFFQTARRDGTSATIHDVVKAGDVKMLEQKVRDGASVNEVDSTRDRFTPLHWACYKGALEVCYLIRFVSLYIYQ